MQIQLFGRIRALCAQSQLTLDIEKVQVNQLLFLLKKTYPELIPILEEESIKIAVNQTFLEGSAWIYGQDEVALLPPVSGG